MATPQQQKSWVASRTIILNMVVLVVLGIQCFTGFFIDPAMQMAALGFINLVARKFTHAELCLGDVPAVAVKPAVPKIFFASRTVWVCIIGIIAAIVQKYTGFVFAPEKQAGLLAIAMIALRFVTNRPVSLT